MESHTTRRFRKLYKDLQPDIRKDAKDSYNLWKIDPYHSSLHFKALEGHTDLWSVRIGLGWRAIGERIGDEITWIWIGSHAGYDKRI